MPLHYLEVVTLDVNGVCAAYSAALGLTFGPPEPSLGGACTARLPDGAILGVRAPLRSSEAPVVRPYFRVDDIEAALARAIAAGGTLALPPMALPGWGRCAIYQQGGNDHGLWQV